MFREPSHLLSPRVWLLVWQYQRSYWTLLFDTETSGTTPWEQVQFFWWATAQWKLVACNWRFCYGLALPHISIGFWYVFIASRSLSRSWGGSFFNLFLNRRKWTLFPFFGERSKHLSLFLFSCMAVNSNDLRQKSIEVYETANLSRNSLFNHFFID